MAKIEELYQGLRSGSINKSQLSDQQIGDVYKYMLDSNKVSASQFKPEVAQKYNLTPQQSVQPAQRNQFADTPQINLQAPYNKSTIAEKTNAPFKQYPMNVSIPKSTTPEMELVDVLSNITMPKNNIELYQRGQDKVADTSNDNNPSLIERTGHGAASIGQNWLGGILSSSGTVSEKIGTGNALVLGENLPKTKSGFELSYKAQPSAKELMQQSDDLLMAAQENTAKGKQGLTKGGAIAYDILTGAGQMGADIGTASLTGLGMMQVLGTRVFGQGASEARQSGADINQQIAYGALSAGIEMATEKIVGGLPMAEKLGASGIADNTIKKMAQGIAKSPKLAKALTYIANMAGEGAEEAISEILQPVAKRLTYDPNADWASMEEVLYSALIGAGVSGVMGGGVYFQGDNQAPSVMEQQTPIVQAEAIIPSQANDNVAVEQSADNNNNAIQNSFKDVGENNKPLGERLQSPISEVVSESEGINPAQGIVAHNNIVNQEINTSTESTDNDLFGKQIDDWISGEFKKDNHLTVLKETPEIYQEYGIKNLPITVASNKLERIINSEGKQKRKYHGLGVEIAKQLPQAIKNPISVLNSHDNNIVVITNLVDGENRPIMASLLIDGIGRIEDVNIAANVMTSAYGRENYDNYIKRNTEAGNVIYDSTSKEPPGSKLRSLSSEVTPKEGDVLARDAENSSTLYVRNDQDQNPSFEDNIPQSTGNVKSEDSAVNNTSERLRQDFDIPDTQINEAAKLTEKISNGITDNNKMDSDSLFKLAEIIHEAHPELTAAEIENGLLDVFMDVSEQSKQEVKAPQQKLKQATQQSTGEQAFKGKTDTIKGEVDMSRPLKRPSEIKGDISKLFNIPVNSRKYNKRKALGFYKVMPEVIRIKYDNDLGVVAHELGHHLDKQYSFNTNHPEIIQSMVNKMSPEFKKAYSESEYPAEAVAEFLRYYLTDINTAKEFAGDFYNTFEQSLNLKDLKNIQEIRADVLRWVNGEWMEKAKKTMVAADENRKTLKDKITAENANMLFFDVFAPFNRYVKTIEDSTGKKVPPSLNPYLLALQTNKNGGRIDSILRGEMSSPTNNIIYKEDNLQKILDASGKNTSEFELYLKLKHALTLEDKGHQIFPKDIEVSQERLNAMEQQFPEFKELSERLYKWYDAYFKAWVIDTNMLGPDSKKIYEVMRKKYPYYVPMFRVKDGQIKGKNTKAGFNDQKSPVDRLSEKGSDRDTISPIDGIVMQVNRAVNAQTKNNVMRSVIEHYKTVDGLGNFIDRVSPDMERQVVSTRGIKDMIDWDFKKNSNAKELDEIINAIPDFIENYKSLPKSRDKDIIGVINKDGKKEFYQVFDENFLKAMTNMDKVQLDFTVQAIAEVRRKITALTTGANPMFALTSNIPRDIQQAFLYGSHNNPFEYAKATGAAVINVLKESEGYNKFKALGGGYGSSIQGAETKMSKDMRNKLTDFRKGKKSTGRSNLDHFIGMIADMNDWAEAAPRYAEYEKAYKKGMELYKNEYDASIYALHKSDDVTLNFMRKGTIMNTAAGQIIPYFNAGLQGIDKLKRSLITDSEVRKQTWIKSITMLTIPTILLWAFHRDDEDYKKLSKGIKDNYWILPWKTSDGAFIRIPKPKDVAALFGSDFERGLNAVLEKEGADAFNGYFGTLLDALTPNTETVFRPIIDVEKNEKWSGGAIVNQSMQGVLKQDQYDDTTSSIAIHLAKAVAQVFPESKYASPKNINYLLDQMGGGVMDILLPLTTPNSYTPIEAVRRKYIADPSYSNDVINEFYELKSATEKANNSFEKKGTITNKIDFLAEDEFKSYYKAIDMYWDNIDFIGKLADKQLTQQQSETFKEIVKRSRYKDTTKTMFNDDLKDKKLSDENIKLLQKSLRDEIVKMADKAVKEYKRYHDVSFERFQERIKGK